MVHQTWTLRRRCHGGQQGRRWVILGPVCAPRASSRAQAVDAVLCAECSLYDRSYCPCHRAVSIVSRRYSLSFPLPSTVCLRGDDPGSSKSRMACFRWSFRTAKSLSISRSDASTTATFLQTLPNLCTRLQPSNKRQYRAKPRANRGISYTLHFLHFRSHVREGDLCNFKWMHL